MKIKLPSVNLAGELCVPDNAEGLVIFSHGSGSSRLSPRNISVANVMQGREMATLLFDLLTEKEDMLYKTRFDISLLTQRLVETTRWVMEEQDVKGLGIGYFGASTGAASALNAAAFLPNIIKAVVSRGGRPDLAIGVLEHVKAPVLLIVGGLDTSVIELNKEAFEHLQCIKEIKIVPGATHLFGETGKLEEVAFLAADWYKKYLCNALIEH
ncbi:MAG: dienelactone hydrolase family protein [Bacteroidia bacterium]